MAGILRISEAANLGIHAMMIIATLQPGQTVTVASVAEQLVASENHLGKVFQRLVHAGYLKSTRGPAGGFALNRDPAEISMLDIVEALDGEFGPRSACMFAKPLCDGNCQVLGDTIKKVHDMVVDGLSSTKLSDFSKQPRKKRVNSTRR